MSDREKLIDVFMNLDDHISNRDEYGVCFTSDFVKAVEKVLKMLKNQDTNGVTFATDTNVGNKWIPVTERLPEPGVDVLVCTTKGISKAHCYEDGSWHGAGGCWRNVTHWRPLPEPPKEE